MIRGIGPVYAKKLVRSFGRLRTKSSSAEVFCCACRLDNGLVRASIYVTVVSEIGA